VRMRKTFVGLLLTVAATVAGVLVAAAPAQAGPWSNQAILRAGHQLTAGGKHSSLTTPDWRFTLSILGSQMSLDEWDRVSAHQGRGDIVWAHMAARDIYRATDRTTLRMQRDGNLVLRMANGHVIWSSHTGGTGSANYLEVLPKGNLVIRTSSGRTVWQTHTTATALVRGDRLTAGHSLVNRQSSVGAPPTWLTMTGRGDLVLRAGARQIWHSNTHRPGSYVALRKDGSLALFGPAGHLRWHSRSIGSDVAAVLTSSGRLLIESAAADVCVRIPAGAGGSCQPG